MRALEASYLAGFVASAAVSMRRYSMKLTCAAAGHRPDNYAFARQPRGSKRCECGVDVLRIGGAATRMRHNMRCFLLGHHYRYIGERDKHQEYACEACGHPLLLGSAGADLENANEFHKSVSFSCILKGHRLHPVSIRNGLVEYACGCGHSFLLADRDRLTFRHPAVCVIKGHYILFIEGHAEHDEFRCSNCGHPFCFAGTRNPGPRPNDHA